MARKKRQQRPTWRASPKRRQQMKELAKREAGKKLIRRKRVKAARAREQELGIEVITSRQAGKPWRKKRPGERTVW